VETKDTQRYTRKSKLFADTQQNKSAITDHALRENHVINWQNVKVIGHEPDRGTRWIKEAVEIRKTRTWAMNRDTGSYFLSPAYDYILLRNSHDTSRRRVDSFSKKATAVAETSTK